MSRQKTGIDMKAAPERKDCRLDIKQLDETGEIEGLGSVFGNVDQGGDIVDPAAFNATLKKHGMAGTMPKMLWQHDPSQVIGVWENMHVEDEGLRVKGRLLKDVEKGREAYTLLKNRAMDGLSIGFALNDYEYEGDGRVRRLKEIDLWEVSVVTFPMNQSATVTGVKHVETVRDVENILRDAGIPATFAKLVASHGLAKAMEMTKGRHRDDAPDVKELEGYTGLLDTILSLERSISDGRGKAI
jgi:HK97 family phage prohead protease